MPRFPCRRWREPSALRESSNTCRSCCFALRVTTLRASGRIEGVRITAPAEGNGVEPHTRKVVVRVETRAVDCDDRRARFVVVAVFFAHAQQPRAARVDAQIGKPLLR